MHPQGLSPSKEASVACLFDKIADFGTENRGKKRKNTEVLGVTRSRKTYNILVYNALSIINIDFDTYLCSVIKEMVTRLIFLTLSRKKNPLMQFAMRLTISFKMGKAKVRITICL